MAKCAEIMVTDSTALLAISGGERKDVCRSEAEVAKRWFCEHFPSLVDRVVIVDARANYTAGDMPYLAECIKELWPSLRLDKITIVCHPDQAEMAEMYLGNALIELGIQIPLIEPVASGEKAPYNAVKLMAHRFANKRDSKWRRWPSWLLRVAANRRYN
ncbi:MAG: hypothetical protein Q8Q05_00330 [bacterium]|nr:hypothetical protein [bacterium]